MRISRKLLSLLLCLVLAVGLLPLVGAPAAAMVDGDWEYESENGLDACLTAYNGSATSIEIPSTVGSNLRVTILGSNLFHEDSTIVSVTIPDTVETIGSYVFSHTGIKSITIPASVKTINKCAFFDCNSLSSVTLKSGLVTIGESAFNDCNALRSITIPSSVKTIDYSAFKNCYALESVMLPESGTTLGKYAFAGCSSLKSIKIPSGQTTIEECSFQSCTYLESVTIPKSVKVVDVNAFYACTHLQSVYYEGSEADKAKISIRGTDGNQPLKDATWYCASEAPVLQSPTVVTEGVRLEWSAVTGASQYRVYRRDNESGSWSGWGTVAKTVKGTSWTDPEVTVGKSYKYRVRAYVSGAWTEYSNAESITVTPPVAPGPSLSIKPKVGRIVLNWTAIPDATQYRVYRRDNEYGGWSSWKVAAKGVKATSWTDTTVFDNCAYKYRVRAYVNGAWTDYSNALTGSPIAPPELLATTAPGKVNLSWTAVPGASQYRVYRCYYDEAQGKWLDFVMVRRLTSGTTWTDTDVTADVAYNYRVRAYVNGEWTEYSNDESVLGQ